MLVPLFSCLKLLFFGYLLRKSRRGKNVVFIGDIAIFVVFWWW
jgi:hypothetical protein